MNKPSDRRDAERVAELLRTAAERIAPPDLESLVTRVLAGATEPFFETDSLIGPVYVAFGLDGVRYVAPATSPEEFVRRYRERFGRLISPVAEDRDVTLTGRVAAALTGERVEVPLDLSGTTPFQRRVLETVKGIPQGEVRPYVWVAREAGNPGPLVPSAT